ncbi:MAG: MFS transporter [Bacteroidota bacterium]|nr:MFS transporter [Bacteroidota bacterium]
MNLSKKDTGKYVTILSLYLAQSIPMSFFSTVVPVIMRMEKYSLVSIGLLQLIKLPWILKFLWAPIVDRTSSSTRQYRKWILYSELFYALIILCIGFFNLKSDFTTIVALVLIAITASATQDIATDAYAILSLKKRNRSLGGSMQSAGTFAGTLVGSGLLLMAYTHFGWNSLIFGLAGFVLIAIVPILLRRSEEPYDLQETKKVSFFEFISFFRQKGIVKHTLILLFFYSGLIGILTMLKPYLVDLGYSMKQIGFMSGIVGTAAGVLMSLPAGFIIRKMGFSKAIYLFAAINLIAAYYFHFIGYTGTSMLKIYIGIALLWMAYAMSSVFIYTIAMQKVRKGREGSDFTTQIVITHLSSMIIAILSGKIADYAGYNGLFITEVLLCLFVLMALPLLFNSKNYQ